MPQPIDLQTELGRTMAAERIQDATARATLLAQQRAQSEEDKVRLIQQAQVDEAKRPDGREVGDREETNEGRDRARKRKSATPPPDERQSPRKALDPGGEHGFDVSV